MGWVIITFYLELLSASKDTLSRWSRLHLQSLAPTPVSRRVDVRQAAGRKIEVGTPAISGAVLELFLKICLPRANVAVR
jgi:hypothetical protein